MAELNQPMLICVACGNRGFDVVWRHQKQGGTRNVQ